MGSNNAIMTIIFFLASVAASKIAANLIANKIAIKGYIGNKYLACLLLNKENIINGKIVAASKTSCLDREIVV